MNWWKKIKEYIGARPYIRIIVGILCIIYGIVALFTPFTPGAWLVFVGLELIGVELVFMERIKNFIKTHFKRRHR